MSQDLREFVREGRNYALLEGAEADKAVERHMAEAAMTRQLRALEQDPKRLQHFLNDALRHLLRDGEDVFDFAAAGQILVNAALECRMQSHYKL